MLLAVAVPVAAVAVLVVAGAAPRRAFEEQLPEILDSHLRSPEEQVTASTTRSERWPTRSASRQAPSSAAWSPKTHLGRPLDAALARSRRSASTRDDLIFVLDAITIQRQVGGSLAELFELVSETVREREQFRRKLRAITGHGPDRRQACSPRCRSSQPSG